jgi:hypothetical protein
MLNFPRGFEMVDAALDDFAQILGRQIISHGEGLGAQSGQLAINRAQRCPQAPVLFQRSPAIQQSVIDFLDALADSSDFTFVKRANQLIEWLFCLFGFLGHLRLPFHALKRDSVICERLAN